MQQSLEGVWLEMSGNFLLVLRISEMKQAYPAKPGSAFMFTVHVFPSAIRVGHITGLVDPHDEVKEVKRATCHESRYPWLWHWYVFRKL
jgi:hypothetical protein